MLSISSASSGVIVWTIGESEKSNAIRDAMKTHKFGQGKGWKMLVLWRNYFDLYIHFAGKIIK